MRLERDAERLSASVCVRGRGERGREKDGQSVCKRDMEKVRERKREYVRVSMKIENERAKDIERDKDTERGGERIGEKMKGRYRSLLSQCFSIP